MKKYVGLLAMAAVAVALTGCGGGDADTASSEAASGTESALSSEETPIEMPLAVSKTEEAESEPPEGEVTESAEETFVDCANFEVAQKLSGVTLTLPEIPEAQVSGYRAVPQGFLEVTYTRTDGGELRIRKGKTGEIPDGEEETALLKERATIGGRTVTEWSDASGVRMASWTEGESLYCLMADPGLQAEAAAGIIAAIG